MAPSLLGGANRSGPSRVREPRYGTSSGGDDAGTAKTRHMQRRKCLPEAIAEEELRRQRRRAERSGSGSLIMFP